LFALAAGANVLPGLVRGFSADVTQLTATIATEAIGVIALAGVTGHGYLNPMTGCEPPVVTMAGILTVMSFFFGGGACGRFFFGLPLGFCQFAPPEALTASQRLRALRRAISRRNSVPFPA